MGRRNHQFRVDDLGRFLLYVLGRRPDEFGLIPDQDGFIKYKDLIRAVNEEPGFSYVRQSHINEVLLGRGRNLFQTAENKIRALEIKWSLNLNSHVNDLPNILFITVRKKAHPMVMEMGLSSGAGRHFVLSADEVMARRIGRRRDPAPVLLKVAADRASKAGIVFYAFGDLFLSPEIPIAFISGPPVSKEILEARAEVEIERKERPMIKKPAITPGSFVLDVNRDPDLKRRAKGRKPRGWKEEAKDIRRSKRQ
ncbi:RNA 2'-phosphotransferase, Tpt1 / KptA family protein [uncultured Desulfobacterium sp.]|uniref:RNA 2'-phosphotransferase, Tpt1 / KptA family protein n=1 Tax=uncultured Desulfobacterium sp. TaxID=201089 RepID=A0A445N3M8_9BACT|nr:RNA 2'-phosphotransferase, Tpt1 / KptA family protein [uncultured Desulfobacterium sp.]